jgi:hypothetical protein
MLNKFSKYTPKDVRFQICKPGGARNKYENCERLE